MTYENLESLDGRILNLFDIVVIAGIMHKTAPSFLFNIHHYNSQIFEILEIEDPIKFCEEYYGYPSTDEGNDFPNSKGGDFSALTRLVMALLKKEREIHKQE